MTDEPERGMAKDVYSRFADLAREKREGEDYRICLEDRRSAVAVIAPHGGHIEPGTSQIAAAIAADDWSLYCFEGLIPGLPHGALHIRSELFDEQCGCDLVAEADIVVAVHGRKDEEDADTVLVGGLDRSLRDAVMRELAQAGFRVAVATGELAGTSTSNICNRSRSREGVQLEIPRSLRASLCKASDALGRFSGAVRSAVQTQLQTLG